MDSPKVSRYFATQFCIRHFAISQFATNTKLSMVGLDCIEAMMDLTYPVLAFVTLYLDTSL
jgi:hypothetical protein